MNFRKIMLTKENKKDLYNCTSLIYWTSKSYIYSESTTFTKFAIWRKNNCIHIDYFNLTLSKIVIFDKYFQSYFIDKVFFMCSISGVIIRDYLTQLGPNKTIKLCLDEFMTYFFFFNYTSPILSKRNMNLSYFYFILKKAEYIWFNLIFLY